MSASKKSGSPKPKGQTVVITISEDHVNQKANIACEFIPQVKSNARLTPAVEIAMKMLQAVTKGKSGE